jgi:hypothetical protein
MTLNCSFLLSIQIMTTTQLEDIQQEDAMYPWLANGSMADNYNADLLDAMSDMAYEQEQAMRESNQSDWEGVIYDDEDAS